VLTTQHPYIHESCHYNSPTGGGRSVGTVRLRTKGHGVCCVELELWGFNVEEKLHLGVSERQGRMPLVQTALGSRRSDDKPDPGSGKAKAVTWSTCSALTRCSTICCCLLTYFRFVVPLPALAAHTTRAGAVDAQIHLFLNIGSSWR
jgi:hypothetical protein